MSEELNPCPFCGGKAELGWHQHIGGDPIYHARCAKACHAMNGWSENRDKAIAAWNRRADRWIPVSERLPEKEGHYFVTAQLWNGNTEAQITYWTGAEREPSNQFNLHCRAVTAWRPLPEPYEEEN